MYEETVVVIEKFLFLKLLFEFWAGYLCHLGKTGGVVFVVRRAMKNGFWMFFWGSGPG